MAACQKQDQTEESKDVHPQQAPQPQSQEVPSHSQPQEAPKPQEPSSSHPFAEQLHALRAMGFSNDELNLRLLQRYRGNVPRALDRLVSQ
jgi:uncharacterized ferritin-like protein (DUF455 family)